MTLLRLDDNGIQGCSSRDLGLDLERPIFCGLSLGLPTFGIGLGLEGLVSDFLRPTQNSGHLLRKRIRHKKRIRRVSYLNLLFVIAALVGCCC